MPGFVYVLLAATWVALGALTWALVLAQRRIRRSELRYARLVEGASAERLEDVLLEHVGQIRANQRELARLGAATASLAEAQSRCIQHLGLVRFNPYDDMGGQYSFALALADGKGSGVVLCSLHGRGHTRLYAKPIVEWASPVPLSEEEQQAVAMLQSPENVEG